MSKCILAGDIGGTNSRLALVEQSDKSRQVIDEENFLSADYDGLIPVIDAFLSRQGKTVAIDAVCLAIAGPVVSGVATVTNLPWKITEAELSEHLQTPRVKLINDFVAAAYGVAECPKSEMLLLQPGDVLENEQAYSDAVVVGAGTGFGAAHLVYIDGYYKVYPSETGHRGFSPGSPIQIRLLEWLQKKHSHVYLELILSGSGLARIYQFLHEEIGLSESEMVNKSMQTTDPAKVIVDNALSSSDKLCQKTLELFVDIYGSEAGNTALNYYPMQELYLAGGIAPKIRDKICEGSFLKAFRDKGSMSDNLKKMTIRIVMQEKMGLYGAMSQALK